MCGLYEEQSYNLIFLVYMQLHIDARNYISLNRKCLEEVKHKMAVEKPLPLLEPMSDRSYQCLGEIDLSM